MNPVQKDILNFLNKNQSQVYSVADLSKAMGEPATILQAHLHHLVDKKGLITRGAYDSGVFWFEISEKGKEFLAD
jgi:DNA-binding IclR family transcriptional regulator